MASSPQVIARVWIAALLTACATPPVGVYESQRYTSARNWFSIGVVRGKGLDWSDASTPQGPQDWAGDSLHWGLNGLWYTEVGVVAIPPKWTPPLDRAPEDGPFQLALLEAGNKGFPANSEVAFREPWASPHGPAAVVVYRVRAGGRPNTLDSWLGVVASRVAPLFYAYAISNQDADVMVKKTDAQMISTLTTEARRAFEKLEVGPSVAPSAPTN